MELCATCSTMPAPSTTHVRMEPHVTWLTVSTDVPVLSSTLANTARTTRVFVKLIHAIMVHATSVMLLETIPVSVIEVMLEPGVMYS